MRVKTEVLLEYLNFHFRLSLMYLRQRNQYKNLHVSQGSKQKRIVFIILDIDL